MSGRARVVIVAAVLVLAALAVTLSLPAPIVTGSPAASSPFPSAAVRGERVVREAVVGSIDTLNPMFARGRAELDLDALLFSGLTRLGSDGSVVPDLAQSWAVSSDGKTWTFRIRASARWQDDVSMTADDVVYTALTLSHPDYSGPRSGTWRGITVSKVDERTVQFRLAKATAGFLATTTTPILPAHLLADIAVAKLSTSTFGRSPVGNGPYRLVSIDAAGARLERVSTAVATTGAATSLPPLPLDPLSWQPSAIDTGLDAIEFSFFKDQAAAVEAFQKGAVDTVGGLDASTARSLAQATGSRVLRYPRTVLTAVVLNLRFGRTLFQNSHERVGLLHAIDRDGIVSKVAGGMASRADSLLPPTSPFYDAKAAGTVSYSRNAAAKELKAAGWKRLSNGTWDRPTANGAVTISLLTLDEATNPLDYAVAQAVAANWKTLGLKVTVTALPPGELVSKHLVTGDYDAAVVDFNLGQDADLYPLLASSQAAAGGSNVSGYQSAELDPLLDAARQYASDAARQKRVSTLETALAKELPMLPVLFADYTYVVRNTVEGPEPTEISTPSDRFWDVITWRTAERTEP
jgi:peptide/nickel transport system substrate-binding protein